MARTDPLTAALLLSHPHHRKHHHHPKVKVPAQAEFHLGNFHYHFNGLESAVLLVVALVVIIAVVAWFRNLF